jgi:hypothetical protein
MSFEPWAVSLKIGGRSPPAADFAKLNKLEAQIKKL